MNDKAIVQKIVLGGVVFNEEGKILIMQRNSDEEIYPNMWELPSGKREPLEGSEVSLKREVKEEAGLDVEIVMPFSIFDYQIDKTDEIRDSTQINFITKTLSDDVKLSDEHQKFDWIDQESLDKYNLTDSTKKVIKEAFLLKNKLSI